jgi:hypothetical protein
MWSAGDLGGLLQPEGRDAAQVPLVDDHLPPVNLKSGASV